MPTKYAHTNIIAEDWEALAQFYTDVFNCVFVPPQRNQSGKWLEQGTGVPNASLEGVHLRLPGHGDSGPTLEIYSYKQMADKPPPLPNRKGYGHLAFSVDDVAEKVAEVAAKGGRMLGEVITREIPGAGIITFTYVADPEGNIIELQSWQ